MRFGLRNVGKASALAAEFVRRFGDALEKAEKSFKGTTDCIGEFKYVTNEEMLGLIE